MAVLPGRLMYETQVEPDWLDELDHVNFLQHQRVADRATDMFWTAVGGPPFSSTSPLALVIVEVRALYRRELRFAETVSICTRVLSHDHRRVRLLHTLLCQGELASTVELLALCFDAEARRASMWPASMVQMFAQWMEPAANEHSHSRKVDGEGQSHRTRPPPSPLRRKSS